MPLLLANISPNTKYDLYLFPILWGIVFLSFSFAHNRTPLFGQLSLCGHHHNAQVQLLVPKLRRLMPSATWPAVKVFERYDEHRTGQCLIWLTCVVDTAGQWYALVEGYGSSAPQASGTLLLTDLADTAGRVTPHGFQSALLALCGASLTEPDRDRLLLFTASRPPPTLPVM